MRIETVFAQRDWFVKKKLGINYIYDYQTALSNEIICALLMRTGEEIPIEISRQAGKTEAIVWTVCFLMTFSKSLSKRFWGYEALFRIVIFAPQKEQVKTDFDRLKFYFRKLGREGWKSIVDESESNQTTLQLKSGAFCYVFPLRPTSSPESKSADLLIFEEAHKIIDSEKNNKASPMGASTNAPEISIGVAWYQKNYFKKLIDAKPKHLRFPAKKVILSRLKAFNETGDESHLFYERHYKKKVLLQGESDPSIRTQYDLEWIMEAGQFMLASDWTAMTKPYFYLADGGVKTKYRTQLLDSDLKSECYAGIDTAKHPDSTVVVILRWNPVTRWKELIATLELMGTNYSDQFTIISGWDTVAGKPTGKGMFDYFNVVGVAIDSTGQGSFMPDYFKTHTKFQDEKSGLFEVKFSMAGKDMIYTNLMQVITNRLTAIPSDDTLDLKKLKKQMLDLNKEYKGQFLSVHHPEGSENGETYHDDYSDAWALAEHVFAVRQKIADPKITIL